MMLLKKTIVILLFLALLPVQSSAIYEECTNSQFIYFEDGSYVTISLSVCDSRSNTKSASKRYTYNDTSGEELWSATLSATFEFDGTEYWTTDCSITIDINNSNWKEVSKSATMSGCGALGEFTVQKRVLGITTKTVTDALTLSCSPHDTIT